MENVNMYNISIKKMDNTEAIPIDLLLLADPSKGCIDDYIKRGERFGAYIEDNIVGAYVLIRTRPLTIELVNIAVYEQYQGKGIGKQLVMDSIHRAKAFGAKVLEVGTGNSGVVQLALYQKCGFRVTGVDRDFFKRYGEKIMENGIECIDMVRLSMEL